MPSDTDDFFSGKRPWSRIKDRILISYMSPYMAKVVKRGQPLLLIDAFAGPGRFEDGNPGSPLIICQAAEKYAKGRYRAIFVNKDQEHHVQLTQILGAAGWDEAAKTILGDGRDLLRSVIPVLGSSSVFLYIDPFGFDCEFETLEPFLQRNKNYSTEILINLNASFHRLAAHDAIREGKIDPKQLSTFHDKLTRTLGGDYWKEALLSDEVVDAKVREQKVIEGYRKRLSSTGYLRYTGACPVLERRDSSTKYYMVFASPHPDAVVLMNDAMCNAFNEYMHEEETQNTLFAGQHWTSWHDTKELERLVVEYVGKYPGRTRKQLWVYIVDDHFMRYTASEYKKIVLQVLESGKITSPTPRRSRLLNDDCILMPA